jgi:hypothetical protein
VIDSSLPHSPPRWRFRSTATAVGESTSSPSRPSCQLRTPLTGSGLGPATGSSLATTSGFFGQDGSGGYAAFWLIRPHRALADQPVVFLGSEGETAVVARDLSDFLWLLADGLGPWEGVDPYDSDRVSRPSQELTAIAERFAPGRRRSAAAVIEQAAREFPDFDDTIMELCR